MASRDPLPTLRTRRLALRAIGAADLDAYHALLVSAVVAPIEKRRPAPSLGESRDGLHELLARHATGDLMSWAITLGDADRLLGVVGLCRFDRAHRRAEVAYELHPDHRGQGLVTEALGRIVIHAFDAIGLHRLEGHVDPENQPSIRVLERNGFAREGQLRQNHLADGLFHDTLIYGRLATSGTRVGRGP